MNAAQRAVLKIVGNMTFTGETEAQRRRARNCGPPRRLRAIFKDFVDGASRAARPAGATRRHYRLFNGVLYSAAAGCTISHGAA
jgi:hypothetical protein